MALNNKAKSARWFRITKQISERWFWITKQISARWFKIMIWCKYLIVEQTIEIWKHFSWLIII